VSRGSYSARIDDKGRLKVPAEFRAWLETFPSHPRLFVTSVDGRSARIYPLAEWEAVEARLAAMPSSHEARQRFQRVVNYYGQNADLDAQGRVLIHPRLRGAADMSGDVDVLGSSSFLDVWNGARLLEDIQNSPLGRDDFAALASHGL
jgi:MraZ protein